MVSVTDLIAASFATQLAELEQEIRAAWFHPSPEAGFAQYVYATTDSAPPLPEAMINLWPVSGSLWHAPDLATAGYELALRGNQYSGDDYDQWLSAYNRVTSRELFPADRQSFVFRPLEMLGIALGAASFPEPVESLRSRLLDVLERRGHDDNIPDWAICLYGLAADTLGGSWRKTVSSELEMLNAETLVLLKWLVNFRPNASVLDSIRRRFDELDLALLQACATTELKERGLDRAAVLHYALTRAVRERIRSSYQETWPVNRESADALEIIIQLCRRFPLFARQLQERRKDVKIEGKKERRPTLEMTDEYDVQDSMHALLRLFFDDVRPEEWTPSYAGSHSRMDFLLKREKIVIETKMTRDNLGQADVANQLAIDKDRYRSHPDCQTLVCFVYDPSNRCKNPTALEEDTQLKSEKLRVIVIVAPKGL